MSSVVEVRCPLGPRQLFTKLKLGEASGIYIHPANLIEFPCGDCRRRMSREHGRVVRVFHRFNFLGELIETVVQDQPDCGNARG